MYDDNLPLKECVIFEKIAEYIDRNYIYVQKVSSNSQLLDLLMNQEKDNTILSGDWAKITPTNWLLSVYQAAREIKGDRIVQLITHNLSEQKDIANDLTKLMRRCNFDKKPELVAPKTNW